LNGINKNGLTIKSFQGDFNVNNIKATDSLNEFGVVDIAIVAVKAWQLKHIAIDLINIIDQNTIILTLQNGISAIDELCKQVSPDRFVGGICWIISKI
jgi:2-dehydropantoate 2-reductase